MRRTRMSAASSSAELPQVCEEEEDLQGCSQGKESALDQEEPEPPQVKEEPQSPRVKEEQEELYTTPEDDVKQENGAFLQPHFRPKSEETSGVSDSDAVLSEEETSGITWRPTNPSSVTTSSVTVTDSRGHPRTELDLRINFQLPVSTDAEVLADWQLSRIQEERTRSPMKSDHQDMCMSDENSQLNLKDEANTFTMTLSYEDGESELESETENQNHQESKLEEAATTSEPNLRKRRNRTDCLRAETPYLSEAGQNNSASKKPLVTGLGKGPASESLHYCKLCGKCFLKKCNLTAHIRTHTGEKPFTCDSCGKRFSQNSHLRVHMTTHTGEKSYACKTCEKTFSRSVNLLRHMRTHTGEKPYPCDTCGKRFSQSFDLLRHERSHTGEKPYPCTICDKTFSQHSNLLYHMRTHTGEKPYLCTTCGKRFSQSSHVWRHMAVHSGDKSQS